MHHLFCWINHNAVGLSAIFTFLYLIATILIFLVARKSAEVATDAVQAAQDNALAAQQSASAAQSSASAAAESAALMRQQFEDQAIRCEAAVRTGVDAALKTTSFWRAKTNDLANMNSLKSLPPTDNLVLPNTVVESAALIDFETAMKLSTALNELRLSRNVLSIVSLAFR